MAGNITVSIVGNSDDAVEAVHRLERSLAELGLGLEAANIRIRLLNDNAAKMGAQGGGFNSLLTNWKLLVPAGIALAGALAAVMTGMVSLAPVAAGLSAIAAAIVTPFTELAAIVVGLLGPMSALATLFGVIGGGAAFGAYTAAFDPAFAGFKKFDKLRDQITAIGAMLDHLGATIGARLLPYLEGAANWVERFISYGDRLAKMTLPQMIHSISTTGMHLLEQANRALYDFIGRPLLTIFGAGFGKAGNRISDAFSSMIAVWTPLVARMWSIFESWFDSQHFEAIGERWANVFGSTILPAMLKPIGHYLYEAILHQPWTLLGVAIGALLVPGIGATFRGLLSKGIGGLFGGGGAAAAGAAGAGVGADAAGGGLLAGLGISAGAATGIGAVALAIGGIAYYLSTIPGPANKAKLAFGNWMGSIRNAPRVFDRLKTAQEQAKTTGDQLNRVWDKGRGNINQISAAVQRHEDALNRVAAAQRKVMDVSAELTDGLKTMTTQLQSGTVPTMRGTAGGAALAAQKLTEFQQWAGQAGDKAGQLATTLLARTNPNLERSLKHTQALANAALILSNRIHAVPTFKQITLQMQIDEIINQFGHNLPGVGGGHTPKAGLGNSHSGAGGTRGSPNVTVHVHAGALVHEGDVGRYISQALTSHFRSGGHVRLASGGMLR